MFRGINPINLDAKGRVALPAKYRDRVTNRCDGHMVLTVHPFDRCLLLYPLADWEEIELKLSKFSSMIPSERRMQRLLLGYATECEMDKSGRVLLSLPLRKHATLDKEVMLVGQLNKLEIWDAETWATQIDADMEVERSGGFELTERLQDFSL